MGLVHARIQLSNALRPDLAAVEVDALVESGASELCIPEGLRQQLALESFEIRTAELADGSQHEVDVVEAVRIFFKTRRTVTTAVVIGNEVLLGAIPMQAMDVLIDPKSEQLILPPDRPNLALVKVK